MSERSSKEADTIGGNPTASANPWNACVAFDYVKLPIIQFDTVPCTDKTDTTKH
jgi:hypothetical protein